MKGGNQGSKSIPSIEWFPDYGCAIILHTASGQWSSNISIDVIGLDTLNHCYDSMSSGLPERFNLKKSNYPSRRIFIAGRLGQKNGRGYYQYIKGKSDKKNGI